jgi:hypothetical protein
MTLIPDNQPPEILKPSEKPFNFPTAFIPPQLSSVLSFWLFPAAPVRGDHLNAILFQNIFIEIIAVIRFVTDKFFRHSGDKETGNCHFGQLHLMGRSACKANGDRKTRSVRNGHDPTPFAAFCPVDGIPLFLPGQSCRL